jgi:hypothetical protein
MANDLWDSKWVFMVELMQQGEKNNFSNVLKNTKITL